MSEPRHHLAFPFRVGADGRAATPPTVEAHVEQELYQLLLTDLGERLYLPELGTNLRRLVFEGADPAAAGIAKATVTQAIGRWLGDRVVIEEVDVQVASPTIEVTVRYRIGGGAPRALRLRRTAR
jgi:phage baseplate assembly protein W